MTIIIGADHCYLNPTALKTVLKNKRSPPCVVGIGNNQNFSNLSIPAVSKGKLGIGCCAG